MFTVLWRFQGGGEEIFAAPAVSLISAASEPTDQMDCAGRRHVAFLRLDGHGMTRTVIDVGDVFVMNGQGRTVATYRFDARPRLK